MSKKNVAETGKPAPLVSAREPIAFTLRQLHYFTAAAEHSGVAKAAAALNVSPASVSAAISELEAICGLQLFVRRHARGLVLTPNGRDMVIEASNLLHLASEFQAQGRRRGSSVQGRLEVGMLVSFASTLVPPLMRRFLDTHPEVDIRWQQGDLDFLVNGLEAGRLELALMYDFDLPSTLRRVALSPMPPRVILPKDHRLADKRAVSLADLAAEPFILLNLPRTRDYFLSIFAELGLTPNVAFSELSVEMVRSLVANNFGYSLLNYVSPGERDGTDAQLRAIPLDKAVRGTALSAVWHYRYRMNRVAQAFLDTAHDYVDEVARNDPSHYR